MLKPVQPHRPSFTLMDLCEQQGAVVGKTYGFVLAMLGLSALGMAGQTYEWASKTPNCKFSDVKGGIALTTLLVTLTAAYYFSFNKIIEFSATSFTERLEEQGALEFGKPLGYKHMKVFFSSWYWTLSTSNDAMSVFASLTNLQKHFLREILSEKQFAKLSLVGKPSCGNLKQQEALEFCLVDEIWSNLSTENKEKYANKLSPLGLYILSKNIGIDEFRKSVGTQNQTTARYPKILTAIGLLSDNSKLLESLPMKALTNILLDIAVYKGENYDQEIERLKSPEHNSPLGDQFYIEAAHNDKKEALKQKEEIIQKITKILSDHPPSQEEFSNALFASGEFRLEYLPALWDVLHQTTSSKDGEVFEKPTQDEFAALEVTENDSAQTLRKNFLKLSLKLHPDRNPNDPGGKQFKVLQDTNEKVKNWMLHCQIKNGVNPLQSAVNAVLAFISKKRDAINQSNPWKENCPAEVKNILKEKAKLAAV
ncbi:MAG: DnaJ domain-containing protein [Candidatus Algichlamydia australiensis]|nr:DnaJ domain-containing protein [Chlamydiales bacterium]